MPYLRAIIKIRIDKALDKNLLFIKSDKSFKVFLETLSCDAAFLQISGMCFSKFSL